MLSDDNKTLLGNEVDIARLVADSLGLKLNVVPTSWEDWPLGISAGRYDVAMFNIAVTEERKKKTVSARWGEQEETVTHSTVNPPGIVY